MSIPTAATQLPATRTAIRVQAACSETTNAEISNAITNTVTTIPVNANGPAPMAARAEPLNKPWMRPTPETDHHYTGQYHH